MSRYDPRMGTLYYGDNLDIIRRYLKDAEVQHCCDLNANCSLTSILEWNSIASDEYEYNRKTVG